MPCPRVDPGETILTKSKGRSHVKFVETVTEVFSAVIVDEQGIIETLKIPFPLSCAIEAAPGAAASTSVGISALFDGPDG